mgnify:CR=1 FL=1
MRKRLLVIMLTASMALSLSACGSGKGSDSGEEKKKEQNTESTEDAGNADAGNADDEKADAKEQDETTVEQINLVNEEGSLVYVRHELTKDYNGADAVRIYFTYTNKLDEPKSAQLAFYPQVFQNGVECEFTIGDLQETNEASSNLSKQVMKDTPLEVAFIYTLQDTANPVTLKVTDYSAENILKDIYQEQELALQ